MRTLLLFFCLVLVSRIVFSQNLINKKRAFEQIECSEEFRKLKIKNIYISDNILRFDLLNNYFLERPKDISDSLEVIGKDNNAIQLNNKRLYQGTLFFTEIKNNYFITELIPSRNLKEYSSRPHFGYSFLFLFKQKKDKLYLIDSIMLNYN